MDRKKFSRVKNFTTKNHKKNFSQRENFAREIFSQKKFRDKNFYKEKIRGFQARKLQEKFWKYGFVGDPREPIKRFVENQCKLAKF